MTSSNIERFITAQDKYSSYKNALFEAKSGRIQSHWIRVVFPQIRGLGKSPKTKLYELESVSEAETYLENDTLQDRLYEISKALLKRDCYILDIFRELDAIKVRSCMTLFDSVRPNDVFARVLDKFYGGTRCLATIDIVTHTETDLDK